MTEEREKLLVALKKSHEMIQKNNDAQNALNKLREDAKRSKIALLSIIGVFVFVGYIDTKRAFLLDTLGFDLQLSGELVILVIGVAAGLILQRVVIKKRSKKVEDSDEVMRLDGQSGESYTYLNSESILPRPYWQVIITQKLIEYVSNQRADSLKEALNLYESEKMHLDKMNSINELNRATKQVSNQVAWGNMINATRK